MKHLRHLCLLLLIAFTAVASATPADSIHRLLPRLKGEERLKAYVSLCNILSGSGEYGQEGELAAIHAYMNEAQKQKNAEHEGNARSLQVFAYYNYNMPDSFFTTLPAHMEFMAAHKQWYLYYSCWNARIERLLYDEKGQTALREAKQMYEDAQKNGDNYGIGLSGYQLGSCYYSMWQDQEAYKYFTEAEQYLLKTKATSALLNLYGQYWQNTMSLRRYDEQLAQAERWQNVLDEYCLNNGLTQDDLPIYYFYCTLSKACAWMEKGELKTSRECLTDAERFAQGNKAMPQVLLLRAQSRYEELCGNYARAYHLAEERLQMLEEFGVQLTVIEAQQTKARLLLLLNRGDEAARLYQELLPRKDSIQKWTMTSQLSELATIYQVDNLRLKERELHLKMIIAVGGCGLLLLLLAGYVYYNYCLRKKNRALYLHIQEQNRAENEVRKVAETLPETVLSKEMQLFVQLDKLMQEERLFTNPEMNRQELAEHLGTNLTYLTDAVREGAGKGIREYLADLRLKHAAKLLADQPSLSVEHISAESGFKSRSTFFRAFRDCYGMSPNEYRTASAKK